MANAQVRRPFSMVWCLLSLLSLSLVGGCVEPREEYDDFLQRADRTPPEPVEPELGCGGYADLTGKRYLMNVLIRNLGDIPLLLQMRITSFAPEGDGASLGGDLRLDTDGPDDPPLSTFSGTMDADGLLYVDVGTLSIPAERSPIMSGEVGVAILLELAFNMLVLDADTLCGGVDGTKSNVLEPVMLGLEGTTFGAKAFGDEGQIPVDVPFDCPCSKDMDLVDAGVDSGG
ncbi:MAG: hypothetical protein MO852_14420 [Candidatus Devosia euplotis]|nr:hypothetical protein [Candidatus Devosia euplotis]